jgi:P27 family predicted phage terminase small subunit
VNSRIFGKGKIVMARKKEVGDKLKILQGHDRFLKAVPDVKPILKIWPAPKDLDEGGRALWNEQGSLLVTAKVLTDLDRPAFLLLCRIYDEIDIHRRVLMEEGMTVASRDGKKSHPCVKALKDATTQFLRLCEKFGLSPYDRGRLDLKIDSQPGDDPVRKFLFDRKKR